MSFQKRYLVVAEPLDDPFSYAVNIYDTKNKNEKMTTGQFEFDLNMQHVDHGRNFLNGSLTTYGDVIKAKRVFSLFTKVFSRLLKEGVYRTVQTIKFWY